jgi:glyoxylase-like metal-dependent hydrolase (beta-lactamase superfamily II)
MLRPVFEVFTVPPFGENTYLVGDAEAGEAIVVDPGGRVDDILRVAERRGVRIGRIVNTHAHVDHVTGVAELKARTGAPFWLHPEARPMLAALPAQAALFGLPPVEVPEVDADLAAGQRLEVGGLVLEVRDTPGHAPGHVTLVGPLVELDGEGPAPFALCGDVIFQGSIGRTDLPGGDYATLMRSIEGQILTLPDETVLYSGHGPATTVGLERRFNPFVREWLAERSVGA